MRTKGAATPPRGKPEPHFSLATTRKTLDTASMGHLAVICRAREAGQHAATLLALLTGTACDEQPCVLSATCVVPDAGSSSGSRSPDNGDASSELSSVDGGSSKAVTDSATPGSPLGKPPPDAGIDEPCEVDSDCSEGRSICSPALELCVACLPKPQSADAAVSGDFGCSGRTSRCLAGATDNLNRCVECVNADNCGDSGSYCENGSCGVCSSLDHAGCGGNTAFCEAGNLGADNQCVECLADSHCDGACVQGSCVPCAPEGDVGCGANQRCLQGPIATSNQCVSCLSSADCGAQICIENECVVCDPVSNVGCAAPTRCEAGELPAANLCVGCSSGLDCTSGVCEDTVCAQCAPGTNAGCDGVQPVCLAGAEPADNRCVECIDSSHCPTGACLNNSCVECDPSNNDGCSEAQAFCIASVDDGPPRCVQCVSQSDCEAGVCENHECIPCATGSDVGCGNSAPKCKAGAGNAANQCVECLRTVDCDNAICSGNQCVECAADADCDNGVCDQNQCVPCVADGDRGCSGGMVCLIASDPISNRCVACTGNADCGDGVCIDNACEECETDADCTGSICVASICIECDETRGCSVDQVCLVRGNARNSTCEECLNGNTECASSTTVRSCDNNAWVESSCPNECANGRCNDLRPLGENCTSDQQCDSGTCSDGICCESACDEPCEACTLNGQCEATDGESCGNGRQCFERECAVPLGGICSATLPCSGDNACTRAIDNDESNRCCTESCTGATDCNDSGECVECSQDSDCSGAASCASGVCECDPGYGGTTCSNVNECETGTDTCDDAAVCSDTDGGFFCVCADGFIGDGETCMLEFVTVQNHTGCVEALTATGGSQNAPYCNLQSGVDHALEFGVPEVVAIGTLLGTTTISSGTLRIRGEPLASLLPAASQDHALIISGDSTNLTLELAFVSGGMLMMGGPQVTLESVEVRGAIESDIPLGGAGTLATNGTRIIDAHISVANTTLNIQESEIGADITATGGSIDWMTASIVGNVTVSNATSVVINESTLDGSLSGAAFLWDPGEAPGNVLITSSVFSSSQGTPLTVTQAHLTLRESAIRDSAGSVVVNDGWIVSVEDTLIQDNGAGVSFTSSGADAIINIASSEITGNTGWDLNCGGAVPNVTNSNVGVLIDCD